MNTQQSNISHVSAEKRPVSGDFAYWSDVVVYIKSDGGTLAMEQRLLRVWFNYELRTLLTLWLLDSCFLNFCLPVVCLVVKQPITVGPEKHTLAKVVITFNSAH